MIEYPDNYVKFPAFTNAIESALASGEEIRFMFLGAPGTGKSMLARLVMDSLLKTHKEKHGTIPDHYFHSVSELYRRYLALNQSTFSDKNESLDSLMKILAMQYVILDDLGNEIKSEASNTFIAELFSYQYDRLRADKRKPNNVIVTTNFGSKELSKLYGERIVDRIFETYTIFQFNNESFRKNMIKFYKN